ncbi:hypothetical protein [Desulfopila aestuarii]|uniref:VCBS repeat-containing protein n=1 Tax=Desulfopila aestuarii DSM 18488 TaxID=1121416 RepID=A0A1M7Y8H4_9BACT|nr:hypothetical protein [Desulfopila aestuarii]SHO48871.1 hypothetical protein SAMN02745220_02514 [Desulfopila aestuarii DSM 18488]
MKISTSTLGMDATMTHRDVQTSQGKLAAAATSGVLDQFQLKIPAFSSSMQRQAVCVEASSCLAKSSVSGDGWTVAHEQEEKNTVGRVVSEIINQPVQVREFSSIDRGGQSFSAGLESKPLDQQRDASQLSTRMSLSLKQIHYQEETLRVSTTGTIETADGRTVNLGLDLALERVEYAEQEYVTGILAARFVDPLVLSFDEGLNVLGNSQFSFDLDNNGTLEKIASLRSGSGFLVLDKNGDGLVNNGSELFGPESGYGYGELRFYDTDNNNWIDENDAIFDRLQLWMGGGSEDGHLVSLRDAGVGALSLASVGTDFQLKAADGRILGQIGNAGIFLTEAGEVRPLAEIDLAVDQETPSHTWPEFSGEMQEALRLLRELVIERRRVAQLRFLAQHERLEQRREGLLERLFALKDNNTSLLG